MGLRLGFAFAQLGRLLARDPRDVLVFSFRRTPRIPRALLERLQGRLASLPRTIKPHPNSPQEWQELVSCEPVPLPSETVEVGTNWVNSGEIALLGRTLTTSWPPTWQTAETDSWPDGPSQSIGFHGGATAQDIKLVWELNRHQYLPSVAADCDEASASELVDILLEWGRQHPLQRTTAWMEGIEVALRLVSWCDTLARLSPLLPTEDSRIGEAARLLSDHATWLAGHLSRKWRLNNNHLLLELVGLTVAGHVLSWHPRAPKWRHKGMTLLAKELASQSRGGRNWEPTTAYHRFVTEALLAARWSWQGFSGVRGSREILALAELDRQVQQHLDVLWQLCDDFGDIPLVGDDDAGVVLPRPADWQVADCAQVFSFATAQGLEPATEGGIRAWPGCGMGTIKQAGIHVHLVAGAPDGRARQGSHRHLDMLSCSVSIDGTPVLIDPGTLTYFGGRRWRDRLRSARVHPGIWSRETAWARQSGLFEIPKPPLGRIVALASGLRVDCALSGHGGVSRQVRVEEGAVTIADEGDLLAPVWSFPIPAGCEWRVDESTLTICGAGWVLEHSPVTGRIEEFSSDVDADTDLDELLRGKPLDAAQSSGYGRLQSGMRLEVSGDWTAADGVARRTVIRRVD